MDLSTLMVLCNLVWLEVLAGKCSVPYFLDRADSVFSQTPERAKNIGDNVFFKSLMSLEGDVDNKMPLGEGQ